jgi:hypothetical protein
MMPALAAAIAVLLLARLVAGVGLGVAAAATRRFQQLNTSAQHIAASARSHVIEHAAVTPLSTILRQQRLETRLFSLVSRPL